MRRLYFLSAIIAIFLSQKTIAQQPSNFTGKPIYQIVTKRNGAQLGIIKLELFPNIAPLHVKNFDSLVSVGFYDSTAFHRVVPGFVIQGGDPNSKHGPLNTWGFGDPNQPMVNAEFSVARHNRGIVSAARKANNVNSATSQFFICVAAANNLNGNYSVYGRVVSGMTVVDTIVNQPIHPQYPQMPSQKIEMFVTRIGSNDTVPKAPGLINPAHETREHDTTMSVLFSWNPVSDAIIYTLEISLDSLFNTVFKTVDVATTSYVLSAGNLFNYSRYYWRVKSNNGGHFSPFSQTRWISTQGETTGLPQHLSNTSSFQVFPNPGTGLFYFNGILSGSTLELLDTKGRVIHKQLFNEQKNTLNLSHLAKGIYFYQIKHPQAVTKQGQLIIEQ